MGTRPMSGIMCHLVSEKRMVNNSESLRPAFYSSEVSLNQFDNGDGTDCQIVRSVAMSANIAKTVRNEVKHLIHISTSESGTEQNAWGGKNTVSKMQNAQGNSTAAASFPCSSVLPATEENVISAIVLSRWDDIMGPQTVHVWAKQEESNSCNVTVTHAIRYITNHTVGQAAEISAVGPKIFIVSDLNLIAQALTFGVCSQRGQRKVPYSMSVLVPLNQYSRFLRLRCLCHQWLLRTAVRLLAHLQGAGNCTSFVTNENLNSWMTELSTMLFSMESCGFGTTLYNCSSQLLDHPLLERALTSHLQTFGCTVVMGTSATDINQFISFLAQFLNENERICSRLVLPNLRYSFHVGLYLQGLLMDEFGCRELCSAELSSNPYPVTAIDLNQTSQAAAVKQTYVLPFNSDGHLVENGDRGLTTENTFGMHGRILHPVKDCASLVKDLLKDMRKLRPSEWSSAVSLFSQKINALAYCLLSHIHYARSSEIATAPTSGSMPQQYRLMKCLNLEDSDFRIVLAAAEKLKPGVYSYVLKPLPDPKEEMWNQKPQWAEDVSVVQSHQNDYS